MSSLKRELRKWCDLDQLGNRSRTMDQMARSNAPLGPQSPSLRRDILTNQLAFWSLRSLHSSCRSSGRCPKPRSPRALSARGPQPEQESAAHAPLHPLAAGLRSPLPLHPPLSLPASSDGLGRWFRPPPRPRRSRGDVAHLSPKTPISARCPRVGSRRNACLDPHNIGAR